VQFKTYLFRWSTHQSWVEPVSHHKCTDDGVEKFFPSEVDIETQDIFKMFCLDETD